MIKGKGQGTCGHSMRRVGEKHIAVSSRRCSLLAAHFWSEGVFDPKPSSCGYETECLPPQCAAGSVFTREGLKIWFAR